MQARCAARIRCCRAARHPDPGARGPGDRRRSAAHWCCQQVVLSFGIPFALIPLIRLTSNRSLMAEDTNHRVTTAIGWSVAALISLLNVVLIYLTVKG